MYKILCLLILIVSLTGCAKQEQTNIKIDSCLVLEETTDIGNKEVVTVEEFKDFYSLENTEIPDKYIEDFIDRHSICYEDLAIRRYDLILQRLSDAGVNYEKDINNLISGPSVDSIDYDNLTHCIMIVAREMGYDDLFTQEYIVLDINDSKLYVSTDNIMSNYEEATTQLGVDTDYVTYILERVSKIPQELDAKYLNKSHIRIYLVDSNKNVLEKVTYLDFNGLYLDIKNRIELIR